QSSVEVEGVRKGRGCRPRALRDRADERREAEVRLARIATGDGAVINGERAADLRLDEAVHAPALEGLVSDAVEAFAKRKFPDAGERGALPDVVGRVGLVQSRIVRVAEAEEFGEPFERRIGEERA